MQFMWQQRDQDMDPNLKMKALGAFRAMLKKTAEHYQFEYMIVDTGPSNSMLNQVRGPEAYPYKCPESIYCLLAPPVAPAGKGAFAFQLQLVCMHAPEASAHIG